MYFPRQENISYKIKIKIKMRHLLPPGQGRGAVAKEYISWMFRSAKAMSSAMIFKESQYAQREAEWQQQRRTLKPQWRTSSGSITESRWSLSQASWFPFLMRIHSSCSHFGSQLLCFPLVSTNRSTFCQATDSISVHFSGTDILLFGAFLRSWRKYEVTYKLRPAALASKEMPLIFPVSLLSSKETLIGTK